MKNVLLQKEEIPEIYDGFILDLSWFSPIQTDKFYISFIEPQLKLRNGYNVYDCGNLYYKYVYNKNEK